MKFDYLGNCDGLGGKSGRHLVVDAVEMEVDEDGCAGSPGDLEEPLGEPVAASEVLGELDDLGLDLVSLSHDRTELD